METIKDKTFGGERPLFRVNDLRLENITITDGESGIKCCNNIVAENSTFSGKYPFWHVNDFTIRNCLFNPGARAAIWYSNNCSMEDCTVDAPKMFRRMNGVRLRNVRFSDALETLWDCNGIDMENVQLVNADYLFMHTDNIRIRNYNQQGNYSFQYCRNVEIRNAVIDSRDAFWETENVTVYDSEISGEFLGWHSRNLTLVRCHINGIQPLCYCHNLTLIDCVMGEECNLAFEDSEVNATVKGNILSVKNPKAGKIEADSIGEIIIDKNSLAKEPVEIKTGK